jgi:hypothetical protein
MKRLATLAALAAILGTLTACSTLDRGLFTATTNAPAQEIILPDGTTNHIPANVTLAVKPGVEAALRGVQASPIPWAGVAGATALALLQGYANAKNKKAAGRNELAAVATIQALDTFRTILDSTAEGRKLDAILRAELIRNQQALGVFETVSDLVSRYTPTTTARQ